MQPQQESELAASTQGMSWANYTPTVRTVGRRGAKAASAAAPTAKPGVVSTPSGRTGNPIASSSYTRPPPQPATPAAPAKASTGLKHSVKFEFAETEQPGEVPADGRSPIRVVAGQLEGSEEICKDAMKYAIQCIANGGGLDEVTNDTVLGDLAAVCAQEQMYQGEVQDSAQTGVPALDRSCYREPPSEHVVARLKREIVLSASRKRQEAAQDPSLIEAQMSIAARREPAIRPS